MNVIDHLKTNLRKSYSQNLENFFSYDYGCTVFYKPNFQLKDVMDLLYYVVFEYI